MNTGNQDATAKSLEDRPTLRNWAEKRVEKGELHEYQSVWNASSLDSLPGLKAARRGAGERLWLTDLRAWVSRIRAQRQGIGAGMLLALVLMYLIQIVLRMIPVKIPWDNGGYMLCHEI